MIEQLLDEYWLLSVFLVLINSFGFIYLRTVNIMHTTRNQVWAAIGSGVLIGLLWLVSTAIGVNAVLKGNPLTIIAHLTGGAIGTYYGMKKSHKNVESKDKSRKA